MAQKETMVIFPFSTVELKLMGAPSIFLTFTDGASWVASWPNRLGAKANAAIKNAVKCFFIATKVFKFGAKANSIFVKFATDLSLWWLIVNFASWKSPVCPREREIFHPV